MPATLYYPADNQTMHCYGDRYFAAYGVAVGVAAITGVLLDQNNAPVLCTITTLKNPPDNNLPGWVVFFDNIPGVDTDTYSLEILDASNQNVLAIALNVSVHTFRGVWINHPGNNARVNATFASYGKTNDPPPLTCQLNKGAQAFPGNMLQGGPKWVFLFPNTPIMVYDNIEANSTISNDTRKTIGVGP